MLSNYEIKTVDFCNNVIGIVKTLVPKFFDKAKYVSLWKTLFKIRIEAKKIHRGCIRIQSMTMAKTISRI